MDKTLNFEIKTMSPQFLVADIELSLKFYTEKLGFDIDFRYEDFYAGISKDGCSIHLKSGRPSIDERINKRKNEDLDIVFSVNGIEQLCMVLSKSGVDFVQPLRQMPYGKEFYIADPDGYIISFIAAT